MKYTTAEMMSRLMRSFAKLPTFTTPIVISLRLSREPATMPMIGFSRSSTNYVTVFVTAPPMMKPTASPATPRSRMKSRNPRMEPFAVSVIMSIGKV